jgi:hypothetical protein
MPEEILIIVKIPLSEIVTSIKEKHALPPKLTEARIEGENLILSFAEEEQTNVELEEKLSIPSLVQNFGRKRRFRKKRNRMKTRGWKTVGRITNSKGQKSTIYEPFVSALQDLKLGKGEQKKLVEQILRSNRNRPSEESIQYFLENTLEYIHSQTEKNKRNEV